MRHRSEARSLNWISEAANQWKCFAGGADAASRSFALAYAQAPDPRQHGMSAATVHAMRRLIAILPLLALIACSQARTASNSPLDGTLTWLPSQLCDRWERCIGENSPPWGNEACETWMGRYVQNVVHARFEEGIRRGTLRVNAGAQSACDAELGGLCDWEAFADPGGALASLPGSLATLSCGEVVRGQVALGGGCVMSEECAGEAFCAPTCTGCAGVCTTLVPEGGAGCRRDAECAPSLACLASGCVSLPAVGFACAVREGRRCASGARCEAGMCVDISDAPGVLNSACGFGQAPCGSGLYCSERCIPERRAGEPCVNGFGGAGGLGCASGLWCTPISECGAALREGDACMPTAVGASACSSPLVCGQDNRCLTPRDNGEACVTATECASRNCAAARCAPPPYPAAA